MQQHYDTSSVFVAVIGRPNVGKSSLTNRLVGEKVAIVTSNPQPTRTRITGVVTRGPLQYVLLDTPGVHKAHNKLGKRMDKTASDSIADVDVSMMLFEPYGALNEPEMVLVDALRQSGGPAIAVINKTDLVKEPADLEARKAELKALGVFDEIYTISVRNKEGSEELFDALSRYAVEGPHYFDDDAYTDMPEKELDAALGGVVEDCVNSVGVDVNTASVSLLSYVAGINTTVAKNIVAYREENGAFTTRAQLKKVPRLGPKAFEQCAGFLRIPGGKDLIENTGVHPESYDAARALLKHFSLTPAEAVGKLLTLADAEGFAALAKQLNVGEPTLRDIAAELSRPGRDPRDELPQVLMRSDVMDLKDLQPGMELRGTVRNVTDFGAFVDIGVHRDGLVHISQMAQRRVNHPSEVVRVGDIVTVWVLEADAKTNRISLTMRPPAKG